MTTDTLVCKCGIEVRIVRLNPQTTALGHVRNPRNGSHYVRLARTGQEPSTVSRLATGIGGGHAPSEGPATRREDAPSAGPSTLASPPSGGRHSPNGAPLPERVHGPGATDKSAVRPSASRS